MKQEEKDKLLQYKNKYISIQIKKKSTMSITATRVQALAQEGIEAIIPYSSIDSLEA